MIIKNIHDLAEHIGTDVQGLKKAIYRGTECGAWIEWNTEKVVIGAIVEGSEAEFSEEFRFPFDSKKYNDWIEELESLCDQAWWDANGDDEDEY